MSASAATFHQPAGYPGILTLFLTWEVEPLFPRLPRQVWPQRQPQGGPSKGVSMKSLNYSYFYLFILRFLDPFGMS